MSESAATAWIIQRLEMENSKMEEEMGNINACDDDEEEEDDDDDDFVISGAMGASTEGFSPHARPKQWTRSPRRIASAPRIRDKVSARLVCVDSGG